MFHLKNLLIFLSFSIKCLGKNRKKIQKPPKRLRPLNKAKGWHGRNEHFSGLMETTAPVGSSAGGAQHGQCRRTPQNKVGVSLGITEAGRVFTISEL